MSGHKVLVQEMYGAVGTAGDLDEVVDRYLAEDFVEHEEVPGMGHTRDTPRQLFKMMRGALTDFHVDVHELLEDDDKVVARVSFVGTHTGDFLGVPASGHPVEISAIDVLQFRDDQCVAHWGVMDMAGAMAQMGAGSHD